MKTILLFLLVFLLIHPAWSKTFFGYYREDTPSAYAGQVFDLKFLFPSPFAKELRVGGSLIDGRYANSESINNATVSVGGTFSFPNHYAEWDSEFSKNDHRRPYSNHSLQGYREIRGGELGLGLRHADFSTDDLTLVTLTFRRYFGDSDFFGVNAYGATNRPDLKSYSLFFRNHPMENFIFNMNYSFGKSQEDINVVQVFKALSARLTYVFKEVQMSLESNRIWGEISQNNVSGISILWEL